MNIGYIYNIGDEINGYEVIEQTRVYYKNNKYGIRSYTCKCLKDGYINKGIPEGNLLKGTGCPLCSGRAIVKGINDIATTKPEMLKYIANKEDGFKYGKSSNKKVLMVCPDCNSERMFSINQLDVLGKLPCKCSDGISYPNKFIMSILEQLGVKFETEKRFKWLDNRYYDFYIKDYNCIIEAHGGQHYIQTNRKGARTLEEETKNDKIKKRKALENGISNYIVLNCSTSDREFIKDSILSSDLPKMLGFSEEDIDWLKCDEFALGNYAKYVCELWDSGRFNTTTELCDYLGVSANAVKYLKKGTELGWCNYDGQAEARKTIEANAGKNVDKLIKYNKDTGGYWKGKNRSKETKEKLRQANLGKKWTPEEKEKFIESRTGKTHNTKNIIICDGIIYTSYRSCGKAYGMHGSTIANYLKGNNKIPQRFIELGLAYHKNQNRPG